ncbi:Mut7-C ubiquitin/RNAse domain-containing protein [Pseudonocardia nigra]|uniref:Mut7-C ubiquitin/RNAse domain-containing protein n=1 Tax=Pseudonocardia nigra TaxID=1921578 RepID=UPI001C5EC017|nr:Mut7-C ubiquitin/RNAse domain-containing protein [Pseudonocardia nigra]
MLRAVDPSLVVRPDRELWLFLAPRRRCEEFAAPYDGEASLGHVVQALGIPLTEVGELTLDDGRADPADRPVPGATVGIAPVPRPQHVPGATGFLLDVHLGTLARRLRLLGVDTVYRNDAEDDALVRQSADERRVLLTRDRGLLMRRALWAGAHVRDSDPADQLADVLDRFAPPLAPWTRCSACNGELAEVPKDEVAGELEPGTRRRYDRFARCRSCGRVYWRGAHSRRLDAIVDRAVGR